MSEADVTLNVQATADTAPLRIASLELALLAATEAAAGARNRTLDEVYRALRRAIRAGETSHLTWVDQCRDVDQVLVSLVDGPLACTCDATTGCGESDASGCLACALADPYDPCPAFGGMCWPACGTDCCTPEQQALTKAFHATHAAPPTPGANQ